MADYVSRAGLKLEHALGVFGIDVTKFVCADFGCNVGGFVDCLLRRRAGKVYAIDTGYGVLDWKLRNDPRVVVMERTNAIHAQPPEKVRLVTIDVAWTRQHHILPAASRWLGEHGSIVTLIKPHYEADPALLRGGVLISEALDTVLHEVRSEVARAGLEILGLVPSPIRGAKGNVEFLAYLRPGTAG